MEPARLRRLEDCSPLLDDPPELVRRMAAAGACLFRRLLPPGDVAPLRQAVEDELARSGVLERCVEPAARRCGPADGAAPAPRAAPGAAEPDPVAYRRLFALGELHALIHHEALRRAMSAVLATGALLVHPRPALRVVPPVGSGPGRPPTPPHQDHLGMQGSERALTAWLPLTDCPLGLGPLLVAEGSQRDRRPYRAVVGARVLTCDAADLEDRWAGADLEVGDVLVFHALTVHRALPNLSDGVRLSVDLRFQPASDPVCELTIRDDPALPYDQVYAELAPDAPARAWRVMPLSVVPYDAAALAPGRTLGR